MADFYNAFSTTSKEEWIEKVKVDLKGKTIEDVLHLRHPVEELNYHSYGLAEDLKDHHNAPGQADFSRGGSTKSNDWKNNVYVPIDTPKK
ncbi:hypothetical protein CW751_03665 [Brumimicrobium salinarum]|uniref:Uncharacterized protein n=1 Tax=Brumimicrobium salinarum TaxID=2058658 RepID=A0A2I0R4X4_9FLAO|nr:hypothetical protein [Brumimicrobium salinarum]PKR81633.1 hypothetical protein CW751_03665 [Brumimicrobium salinarum]